jgi:hypothetical protein
MPAHFIRAPPGRRLPVFARTSGAQQGKPHRRVTRHAEGGSNRRKELAFRPGRE